MRRNRSRAVTPKQALMPDQSFPPPSPSQNHTKPISSFLSSPKMFRNFLAKGSFETDKKMSPTSILDTKPFTTTTTTTIINQPFGYYEETNQSKPPNIFSGNKHPWEELDPKGVGLALVDSLIDERSDQNFSQHNSRKVLFGSKLKIQIPPIPPSPAFCPSESLKSPADFGIKTRNSQLMCSLSPFGSSNSSTRTKESPPGFLLSPREMELSEDYTCVISHGPNPKTTHIYGDCIVEESGCGGGGVGLSEGEKEYNFLPEKSNSPPEKSFLSFCYTCKKKLEQGKDIYMYRGEKAFCSSECRCREMLFDGVENPGIS